ncbi:hypothetical protein GCM10023203_57400 [Actinomycetospora straminea]|uniref:GH16 domain-containing protein n=1 Tax=Actinomycetospora straminea TaxID=663607 RepID=A0ABP9F9H0_9PSEU
MWPAGWLIPVEGNAPPELDILEGLMHQPSVAKVNAHKRTTRPGAYSDQMGPKSITLAKPMTERHTYGAHVKTDGVDFYIDGKLATQADASYVPDRPMYLICNLAVNGSWPRDAKALVNDQTKFPATMTIHAARLWEGGLSWLSV